MPPHNLHTRILLAFVALIILTFSLFGLVQQVVPAAAASSGFTNYPTPKALSVSPSSFTNCWTCVATLTNLLSKSLAWSANTTTPGVSFNPSSGNLPANGTAYVTITVPKINCPATATFLFNAVSVPWSCSAPPSPSPTPSPTPTHGITPTPTPGTATPTPTPGVGTPTATPTSQSTPISGSTGNSSTPVTGGTSISSTTQTTGNKSPVGGNLSGGSSSGGIFTIAALFLAVVAFVLYLIPLQSSSSSLFNKLLSLVLPASLLRRLYDRQER